MHSDFKDHCGSYICKEEAARGDDERNATDHPNPSARHANSMSM
jgi:hypothetical protein